MSNRAFQESDWTNDPPPPPSTWKNTLRPASWARAIIVSYAGVKFQQGWAISRPVDQQLFKEAALYFLDLVKGIELTLDGNALAMETTRTWLKQKGVIRIPAYLARVEWVIAHIANPSLSHLLYRLPSGEWSVDEGMLDTLANANLFGEDAEGAKKAITAQEILERMAGH